MTSIGNFGYFMELYPIYTLITFWYLTMKTEHFLCSSYGDPKYDFSESNSIKMGSFPGFYDIYRKFWLFHGIVSYTLITFWYLTMKTEHFLCSSYGDPKYDFSESNSKKWVVSPGFMTSIGNFGYFGIVSYTLITFWYLTIET